MPKRRDLVEAAAENGNGAKIRQIMASVQSGALKPRAADAMLAGLGVAFDTGPMFDDPTARSDWHLSLAVIFYAWQDLTLVRSEWRRFERWSYHLWKDEFDPRQVMDLGTAEETLKRDLLSGKVRSSGYVNSDTNGSFVEIAITATEWDGLAFWKPKTLNKHMWGASEEGDNTKYGPVTVLRSDVVSLWLNEGNLVSEPKKRERLTVDQTAPKRAGGASERYDWEGMWIEIVRLSRDGALPSRAKLPDHLARWFLETTGEEPGSSTIRAKVKRLFDTIGID